MQKIKIVKYPNPFLNIPTIPVEDVSAKKIKTLINNLFITLGQQKVKGLNSSRRDPLIKHGA